MARNQGSYMAGAMSQPNIRDMIAKHLSATNIARLRLARKNIRDVINEANSRGVFKEHVRKEMQLGRDKNHCVYRGAAGPQRRPQRPARVVYILPRRRLRALGGRSDIFKPSSSCPFRERVHLLARIEYRIPFNTKSSFVGPPAFERRGMLGDERFERVDRAFVRDRVPRHAHFCEYLLSRALSPGVDIQRNVN